MFDTVCRGMCSTVKGICLWNPASCPFSVSELKIFLPYASGHANFGQKCGELHSGISVVK